jgi:hypothetical protein
MEKPRRVAEIRQLPRVMDAVDQHVKNIESRMYSQRSLARLTQLFDQQQAAIARGNSSDSSATAPKDPPTRTNRTETARLDRLGLTGIVLDDEKKLVVINGEIHRLNDVINGVTVLEIREESVVFEFPDGTRKEVFIFDDKQEGEK